MKTVIKRWPQLIERVVATYEKTRNPFHLAQLIAESNIDKQLLRQLVHALETHQKYRVPANKSLFMSPAARKTLSAYIEESALEINALGRSPGLSPLALATMTESLKAAGWTGPYPDGMKESREAARYLAAPIFKMALKEIREASTRLTRWGSERKRDAKSTKKKRSARA